jgi:hypothetical protein
LVIGLAKTVTSFIYSSWNSSDLQFILIHFPGKIKLELQTNSPLRLLLNRFECVTPNEVFLAWELEHAHINFSGVFFWDLTQRGSSDVFRLVEEIYCLCF